MSGPLQPLLSKPRRLLVGVAVLLPLVLAASGAEAAACKKVSGSFTLTPSAARRAPPRWGSVAPASTRAGSRPARC
jgi:hypothetical protein